MASEPGGKPEPAKTEEDPTRRKAAEDPFEPVDPDDPLLLSPEPKTDPYLPDEPFPDPTRNLRVPVLPAAPLPAPSDPPGRSDLRKQIGKLAGRRETAMPADKDAKKSEEAKQERLAVAMRAGRGALGEHWQVSVGMMLGRREAGIDSDDKDARNRLADLRKRVASHQDDVVAALGDWCTARDKIPADEVALAAAMARAEVAVDGLGAELRAFATGNLNSPIENDALAIGIFAEASLARLQLEGAAIADGKRLARAPSGESLSTCLLWQTAGMNLRTRLEQIESWTLTAGAVEAMIGKTTLNTKITTKLGMIDLTPANDRVRVLDKAIKALNADALAKAGTSKPTQKQLRADVLQGYNGVIDVYAMNLAAVRGVAADVAAGKTSGWTADKLRETADILTGTLRHLQAELAGLSLVEDPDFASPTRDVIAGVDLLLKPSSLELAADALGKDLRKAWSTTKTAELKALKKERVDTAALSKAFDSGLGPLLDTWTAETAKFPKHDRAKLKKATTDAALVLAQYRAAVESVAGPNRSSRLVQALDALAVNMARQIASYDQRGGLF